MLKLSKGLTNQQVLSLRTGGQVAVAIEPIINPNNLKLEGFYCQDRFSRSRLILLAQEIKDQLPHGFVVNDHEVLAEPNELVRLKPVLDLGFKLIGKTVVSSNKNRIGKVNDYAVDDATLYVQKIYVSQSLTKGLGGQLSIDRNQIIEITDKKITIQDPMKPVKGSVPNAAPAIS